MPREVFGPDYPYLPRADILSFEEIARLVGVFRTLGVVKVRITGGEPLLRRNLDRLVGMLAAPGDLDLALTTNGALLADQAAALAAAGLDRVTVSLDSLDDDVHRRLSDTTVPVERVLEGIRAAEEAGLGPVKINAVIRRGVNEGAVRDLVRHFRGTGAVVRFIEFMDVGTTNSWSPGEVVPAEKILGIVRGLGELEPIAPRYPGEVARRYQFVDDGTEIGVIASVSAPFCGECRRARLATDGRLFTCLFAGEGIDLREPLRGGASESDLSELIASRWRQREDRYSELRSLKSRPGPRVEMSYIGG